jgi:hypothetical protein
MTQQIFELIPKVMADIGAVAKTQKNEAQKYMFRGIDALYQAAHPAMVAHGVFCAPEVVERTEYRYEKVNDYGKATTWVHVMLKIVHRFYAPDGSFVAVTTVGEGLDNSDKASSKCMSAAMKYALIELLCIPTADIEDSDRTTPEAGMKRTGPIAEPVTLAPIPPVKKPEVEEARTAAFVPSTLNPPVEMENLPFQEEQPKYITTNQQQYLAKRFRESIRKEKQGEAEEARHAVLAAMRLSGLFKSQFVDADGNPTSKLILTSEYNAVGAALVKAAKSL